jgi:hypothetical protein
MIRSKRQIGPNTLADFDCYAGVVLKRAMKALEDDNGTGDIARQDR